MPRQQPIITPAIIADNTRKAHQLRSEAIASTFRNLFSAPARTRFGRMPRRTV